MLKTLPKINISLKHTTKQHEIHKNTNLAESQQFVPITDLSIMCNCIFFTYISFSNLCLCSKAYQFDVLYNKHQKLQKFGQVINRNKWKEITKVHSLSSNLDTGVIFHPNMKLMFGLRACCRQRSVLTMRGILAGGRNEQNKKKMKEHQDYRRERKMLITQYFAFLSLLVLI